MNFLIDHNMSPHIARAIDAVAKPYFDDRVIALRDKFPENTEDQTWIGALASEGGWCFITADKRISQSSVEKSAVRKARLTGFILSSGLRKRTVVEQTARLLLQWSLISN
ncbi:MAG: hypothetical protein ACPGGK_09390 [Pikeienuella sp.]